MSDAALPVRRLVTYVLAVILLVVLALQAVQFVAESIWPDFCPNVEVDAECSYPGK